MQSFFKIWTLCIITLFGNNVFSQKNHKLEYEAQKSFETLKQKVQAREAAYLIKIIRIAKSVTVE